MLASWRDRRRGESRSDERDDAHAQDSDDKLEEKRPKWSLGILNDKHTDEVPGSVLLLSKIYKRNEPLGLQHARARTSASSLPSPYALSRSSSLSRASIRSSRRHKEPERKKTSDGKIILEPQPEDTPNDPLNWPAWRRDAALLSLGFYCMLGGGMTPILAAGYQNVSSTYGVTVARVSLTTGLYMMGLGVGGVIASPTAILFGKRPVYLVASIMFILSAVWCALSPNYNSLLIARVVQGLAVSPVECLPSATIAEIFFLHERAYRLGIYTLLLLGGKNLVPLVSALIVQGLGWRWSFWVVAMAVGLCSFLLFFFVPETFWDRTPRPRHLLKDHHKKRSRISLPAVFSRQHSYHHPTTPGAKSSKDPEQPTSPSAAELDVNVPEKHTPHKHPHVEFAPDTPTQGKRSGTRRVAVASSESQPDNSISPHPPSDTAEDYFTLSRPAATVSTSGAAQTPNIVVSPARSPEPTQSAEPASEHTDHLTVEPIHTPVSDVLVTTPGAELEKGEGLHANATGEPGLVAYTDFYRQAPPKSYVDSLKIYSGRLAKDNWFHVAARPFVLFLYPAVLWSSVVYALSVGWLIVLSESVSVVYRDRETYNFTALQVGLVYLSPFIGGILGTAVAGKVSDIVVRFLSGLNDGVYEPEFRLFMAIPVAACTTIGLMGFGWSAEERDSWIAPTLFFGVISFGCSLGSTTAITFCVDSYRQYAGEALVTLNFTKNICHGLVFSLFFTGWLESDGSKKVFLCLGGIQLACLLFSIPMYIYGKRARMWTVRKNLMEKF